MEHIPYFDAHCDTIYRCLRTGAQLRENDGHLDLRRASAFGRFAQVFALYQDPEEVPQGSTMVREGQLLHQKFLREMEQNRDVIVPCRTGAEVNQAAADGKMAAILSIEGAELIGCDPGQVETAAEWGVRFLNPVWNWPNVLSGTNCRDTDRGPLPSWRRLSAAAGGVPYLPRRVPHQRPGVLGRGAPGPGPVVATHSNSRVPPPAQSHRRHVPGHPGLRRCGGAEPVPAVCRFGGHHGGAGGPRGAFSGAGRGESSVPGRRSGRLRAPWPPECRASRTCPACGKPWQPGACHRPCWRTCSGTICGGWCKNR